MSERDSNAEILVLLETQRSMDQMDQEFEKEWHDVENRLDKYLLCVMTSRILVDYNELSFEEIMLTLNYVFVGHSDGESVFSIKNINDKNEKLFCFRLLNNLVKIMKKLTIHSSKVVRFGDSHSDDSQFRMSTLLLRIIRAICVHLDNLPILVGREYVTLIKPLLQTLTDDFLILKLCLYDFICDNFSSRDDFRVFNSVAKIRSSDLPHHPCNGPFNEEMKRKFQMVKRNLSSENNECDFCNLSIGKYDCEFCSLGSEHYKCDFCKCPLYDLGDIAIWPDCEHVCYCSDCARFMFIGKGNSKPEDVSIQKSRLIIKNKCPKCSIPISMWSIGRYFGDNVVDTPDVLPSAPTLQLLEYETLRYILSSSCKQRRTVSYVLSLVTHAFFYLFDMKYTAAWDSKWNLKAFKMYRLILSELRSRNMERGNSFLVQINIRCLQEAAQDFQKNLSLYSRPNSNEEFVDVLNQIEKALGDLETKFLTVTA